MTNRQDVRDFLTSRRGRLTPADTGIDLGGARRRVPGLRRDEVAHLAGVSVDYYTRLERGNLSGASDAVLDGIARALQLSHDEHDHLLDLARSFAPPTRRSIVRKPVDPVTPAVRHLLDAITGAPAFITNNRMDMVAANSLAVALYSDMYAGATRTPNHSRFIFLDDRSHDFYPDWERAANTNVAILRRAAGRTPNDSGISALVGELSVRSDDFRTRWAAHEVRNHYAGLKQFHHVVVGFLELNYVSAELPDMPGHTLTFYPAPPRSPSEEGLKLLASWAATENMAERINS